MASESQEDRDRFEAWKEWKRVCDYFKCNGETCRLIGDFVFRRLKSAMIRNAAAASNKDWSVVRFSDFFHLEEGEAAAEKNQDIAFGCFEQLLTMKENKGGIRGMKPKDWLFESGTRSGVEGRCSSGIKTELLRMLTFESRKKPKHESFDPKSTEGQTSTDETDGTPGCSGAVFKQIRNGVPTDSDMQAYQDRAEILARDLFDHCDHVARVALLAKYFRISTDDPRVNAAAGAGRSKLSSHFRDFSLHAQAVIDAEGFERDEQDEAALLSKLIFEALMEKLCQWAKHAEKMEWAASSIASD